MGSFVTVQGARLVVESVLLGVELEPEDVAIMSCVNDSGTAEIFITSRFRDLNDNPLAPASEYYSLSRLAWRADWGADGRHLTISVDSMQESTVGEGEVRVVGTAIASAKRASHESLGNGQILKLPFSIPEMRIFFLSFYSTTPHFGAIRQFRLRKGSIVFITCGYGSC